jgi:fructokinase
MPTLTGSIYLDVVGTFQKAYPSLPINFETDVNAPAMFEAAFGSHGDVSSLCYITIGTGVGIGICIDGRPVHGFMHPEAGHMHVPIAEEDIQAGFKGTCPFHGSCVEGMTASNAIAARLSLERRALETIPDDDPVWQTIAHYMAHVCLNLTLTVSPQVIVIGGGISKRNGLFEKIHIKVCIQQSVKYHERHTLYVFNFSVYFIFYSFKSI